MEKDASLRRLFTKSSDGALKIWDTDGFECIKALNIRGIGDNKHYDPTSKTLIVGSQGNHHIYLLNGENGEEIPLFSDVDPTAELTSFHFNVEKGLAFAAFYIRKPVHTKIMVWDMKTQALKTTLATQYPNKLHDLVNHIDFDPVSGLILTGGHYMSLWNIEEGKLIKTFRLQNTGINQMHWDKAGQKLYVLANRKLYLKDYSEKKWTEQTKMDKAD